MRINGNDGCRSADINEKAEVPESRLSRETREASRVELEVELLLDTDKGDSDGAK